MSSIDHHSIMHELPHYREKYDAQKKVNVYYIPAVDSENNQPMFFYAITSASLHEQMMHNLFHGNIPNFAVIVEKGYGEPSDEIKDRMKAYYGFDHELHAGNDNLMPLQAQASSN